eukprot:14419674-Heterocapsa_arctica.AAC.1
MRGGGLVPVTSCADCGWPGPRHAGCDLVVAGWAFARAWASRMCTWEAGVWSCVCVSSVARLLV